MSSQDIPGFDPDPDMEELLSANMGELDESTRSEVQLYKSRKLQAKRDAGMSEDRPEWWGGGHAPETLEQTGAEGADAPAPEPADAGDGGESSAEAEAGEEPSEEESEPEPAETAEESTGEEPEPETPEEPEKEPEPAAAATNGSNGSVDLDPEDVDFDEDPELEELLDEDIFELDEEKRSEVQLYKSRKMQARRDARRRLSGGEDGGGGAGGAAGGEAAGNGKPDKKAPPPTDVGKYRGERKIGDLVSSRESGREVTRRGFISSFGLGMTGMMAGFLAGGIGSLRFFFPNVLSNPPEEFIAGEPSDYQPGTVSTKYKDQYRVWIVNNSERIYAILAICTHLGCTPNWLSGQGIFKCPCHGSAYYMSGVNFAGPAPRPMDRVAVRLNPQGKIVVDKSQTFSASASPGWNADAAYIPV